MTDENNGNSVGGQWVVVAENLTIDDIIEQFLNFGVVPFL